MGVLEQRLRLVQPGLERQDLGDVVVGKCGADHVASTQIEIGALPKSSIASSTRDSCQALTPRFRNRFARPIESSSSVSSASAVSHAPIVRGAPARHNTTRRGGAPEPYRPIGQLARRRSAARRRLRGNRATARGSCRWSPGESAVRACHRIGARLDRPGGQGERGPRTPPELLEKTGAIAAITARCRSVKPDASRSASSAASG